MINKIPIILIFSRFVLGIVVLLCSYLKIENYEIVATILISVGLLTDIFDGIIARHLNISTQNIRRLDSSIDQIFFICVVTATFLNSPAFFKSNIVVLSVLVFFEILTYVVSYIRFKREIATHSIGAKVWTLVLFATVIQVTFQHQSFLLLDICFWLGIITRIEIIAIIITLKQWTNDVPSLYHALILRKGREIKRRKLFNG